VARSAARAAATAARRRLAPHPASLHAMATSATMDAVFPDALTPLVDADPEVYGIIKDEENRQW